VDETGAHLGQVEDHDRSAALLAAQTKAKELFDAVEDRRLILPGTTDKAASTAIHDLAGRMFGVSRHWHKRIVRSGPHTLLPYKEDPPDRVIEDDDIVFTDFGPVFEAWEADLGRTYVMGDDPRKLQLRDDVGRAFALGKRRFEDDLAVTGAELFAFMNQVAAEMGWECGSPHCGHIIGEFPHERIESDKRTLYITPGSNSPMRRGGQGGMPLHWILEVHFVDRARGFGGFFEELLTL
jgi:Xaa-Pro aminopeptidase